MANYNFSCFFLASLNSSRVCFISGVLTSSCNLMLLPCDRFLNLSSRDFTCSESVANFVWRFVLFRLWLRPGQYYRFLSTGNSIDEKSPETTAETNPVCWQIEVGSLPRGFAGWFETSCERTPAVGFASSFCLASNGGAGGQVSKVSGP